MLNLNDANTYFETYVLHSEPWDNASEVKKQKALNNAEAILYREFRDLYDKENPEMQIPSPAICEQALWLLRQDDTILKAEMGVTGISVSGINVQTKGTGVSLIAPEAKRIISEDQKGHGYDGLGWLVL